MAKVTAQAKGRATKAAKDQAKTRGKMIAAASEKADRLVRSGMAADKKEFRVNKVPTKAQELSSAQNWKSSLRRSPRNRPNAKKK